MTEAASGTDAPEALPKELLEVLACPACDQRPAVRPGSGPWVECTACGRRYPYRDGIVVMLPEEADTASPRQ